MDTENEFAPKTEVLTIVYDESGKEITRFPGRKQISGKDFANVLPITYKQVSITTQLLNVVKIENPNKEKGGAE